MWTLVYKAIQEPLDRPVILKVLNPKMNEDAELLERFEREAKICANLVHPNIVRLFDYGKWRGEYFIVQEWVEGFSLKDILTRGQIAPEPAIRIIHDVALGLAFAHSQGVIHRDVKPGNIITGSDGKVKITDFGLAASRKLPEITIEGTFIGTPAYGAPEQVKGGKVDARSDIFSFGIVCYEILTGNNPFNADSFTEIIERISKLKPKPANRLNSSVSPAISRIVGKMLNKKPSARYKNLSQFLDNLQGEVEKGGRFISESELAACVNPEPQRKVEKTRGEKKFPVWLYPVLAVAACVLIAGFFVVKSIVINRTREKAVIAGELADTVVPETSHEPTVDTLPSGKDTIVTPVIITDTPVAGSEEAALRFQVKPWSRVYVDGKYWETTPTERVLTLKPGKHVLKFENDYLAKYEKTLNLKQGETLFVNVNLLDYTSWLLVAVRPWGRVYVNDSYVSTTPFEEPVALRPGTHRLKITHPSLDAYEIDIFLSPGDTLKKVVNLEENM